MSVIANLDINLRGNTSGIEKGAAKTSQQLDKVQKAVKQHTAAIESRFNQMAGRIKFALSGVAKSMAMATGGVSLITGALASIASIAGVEQANEDLDALGKASDKIGMTSEALAGFRYAADLAGVSGEALDKAIIKMQRNLSQAAMGSGPAAQALIDLGLSAELLKNAGPEEAFQAIAAKLNDIPNAADKAAVAMDIFGKAGADLLPLISESGELGNRIKEASELGLSATRAQIAEVEAANDAITTMKAGWKGLFRSVSIAVAPFIKSISDGITDALKYVNSFRDTLLQFSARAQFVWQNFGEYVDLAITFAQLKWESFKEDTKNLFYNVLPELWQVLPRLAGAALENLQDRVAYALVRIANNFEHLFTEFLPTLFSQFPKLLKAWITGDEGGMGEAMDLIKAATHRKMGDIEKMLAEDVGRSANILDKALKPVSDKLDRAKTSAETALEGRLAALSTDLSTRQEAFVEDRMKKLGISTPKKATGVEDEFERSGKGREIDNRAVERGTQEALKLVAGNKEDKQIKELKDVKKGVDKTNDLLAAMLRKPGLGKANI